jgi:hypothetical protein
MARIATIFVACQLLLASFNCSSGARQAVTQPAANPIDSLSTMSAMTPDLSLQFTVTEKPPLAFGYVYECTITEAQPTAFVQAKVLMSVLVGDKAIQARFKQAVAGDSLTATFMRYKEDVPNRVMAITGFVDENKTAWKLQDLK